MSTIPEVDVIANFRANADGAGKRFQTSARIHGETSRTGGESDGICKSSGRVVIGDTEIIESDFSGHKNSERAGSSLEFRSKKAV